MIDIAEAIDVALTLLRAAVWMAAGIGFALTGLVLLCVWAVTGGVKAARKRLTGARRRAQGPEAVRGPHGAHEASQGSQKDFSYQEAA